MRGGLPTKVKNVTVVDKDHNSITLQWLPAWTQTGKVLSYEVVVEGGNAHDFPSGKSILLQVSANELLISQLLKQVLVKFKSDSSHLTNYSYKPSLAQYQHDA